MFKEYKGKIILTSVITLVPILLGLLLWNKLPDQIPTHWNAEGVIDGWSSKAFAVFALPGILVFFHLLCVLASSMDPKRKNYSGKLLGIVFWICPVISLVMMGVMYGTALGMKLKVDVIMLVLVGVTFLVVGNYMPKCKQNYTMGIKIPWTLNDEENWNYTHRFAGKLWMASGLLVLVSIFLPTSAMVVILMIVLFGSVIIPVIASYRFYKKKDSRS